MTRSTRPRRLPYLSCAPVGPGLLALLQFALHHEVGLGARRFRRSTRMFSIFASPSVRRPLTSAAIWATSGSLLASAIGITAMVVGPRAKMQPGRSVQTAMRQPRMASARRQKRRLRCGAG